MRSIAFSPDGQILAVGRWDGSIQLWQVSSGQLQRTLRSHTHRVSSIMFSPDGQTLAAGSHDNTIKLWRVTDGAFLQDTSGPSKHRIERGLQSIWRTAGNWQRG